MHVHRGLDRQGIGDALVGLGRVEEIPAQKRGVALVEELEAGGVYARRRAPALLVRMRVEVGVAAGVDQHRVAGAGGQNTSLASDAYLQRGGASIPPEGNGAWDTYYTNEGVAYYVNSQTGVTQWEKPNP